MGVLNTSRRLANQQRIYDAAISGLSGIGSLYAQNQAMQIPANNIQTDVQGPTTDASGKPIFGNIGVRAQQIDAVDPAAASAGEIFSGGLTGAQTGAEIGSLIPGVGTLLGAGIGAVGGALSSVFGGESRETEMAKRKRLAERNLRFAQNQYNTAMSTYNNAQTAESSYRDAMNPYNRMYNIYAKNTGV